MQAKERAEDGAEHAKPLLMVDIDGVISLFGGWGRAPWAGAGAATEDRPDDPDARSLEGSFHSIDGTPHYLSATAAAHLLALSSLFELVWASGWEERANEHLPHLLGLPQALPFLRFERSVGRSNAHWKLEAIDSYAGRRPLAWIDDALNDACHEWAHTRPAPTLLVQTEPQRGLTEREATLLTSWARELP
ncbi:MAG TPA: HAD domain-containing protein [Solirubrobacteraceae bacterium]|nr:HAD domain-containing protein [Solirubrobacteraceae bacterium]